jgi:hypothetical protein
LTHKDSFEGVIISTLNNAINRTLWCWVCLKTQKKALLVNSTPKVGQRKPTAVKHLNVLDAPCFEQVNHSHVPDMSALVRADGNALLDVPHDVEGCFVPV